MLIQMSYLEFASCIELMSEMASMKAFLTKMGEPPEEILEILNEARRKKEIVVFAPGVTFYGETDIFAIEQDGDDLIKVLDVFKKYSGPIDGIFAGIFALVASIKFLFGALTADLEDIAKVRSAQDQVDIFKVRHRTLAFLLWKRQKREARARFGDLDSEQ